VIKISLNLDLINR